MGLDMYLTREVFVGGQFEHRGIKGVIDLYDKEGNKFPINVSKLDSFVEQVAYWRKANAIHRWFVEEVQDGEDDCGKYIVTADQLSALLSDVEYVLANRNDAADILPVQEGFFFGATNYDEWYFNDLEYTRKVLIEALQEGDGGDFFYHSSW